jgi:hypothetical protein
MMFVGNTEICVRREKADRLLIHRLGGLSISSKKPVNIGRIVCTAVVAFIHSSVVIGTSL